MMLNTSWYSLLDLLGHALLICRPGYTAFAPRTHVFRWNFVSACADHHTSLCDDGWFDGSTVSPAVCSLERGIGSAKDERNKRQQHRNDGDYDNGLCTSQPHAPRERVTQQHALRPMDNLIFHGVACEHFNMERSSGYCSLQHPLVATTTASKDRSEEPHNCKTNTMQCNHAELNTPDTAIHNIPKATTTWHDTRHELVMRRPQQDCHVALSGAGSNNTVPPSAKSVQIVARFAGGSAFAATSDNLAGHDFALCEGSLADVTPRVGALFAGTFAWFHDHSSPRGVDSNVLAALCPTLLLRLASLLPVTSFAILSIRTVTTTTSSYLSSRTQ